MSDVEEYPTIFVNDSNDNPLGFFISSPQEEVVDYYKAEGREILDIMEFTGFTTIIVGEKNA